MKSHEWEGSVKRKEILSSVHMYAFQLVFAPGPLVASPSASTNRECGGRPHAKLMKVGTQKPAVMGLSLGDASL